MKTTSLEDVIKQYITLPSHPNNNGFYSVNCAVCHDHGRKGLRAGFKFDNNGIVGYNCFNCGHTARHDPSIPTALSNNMIKVLESFGIPADEYSVIHLNSLQHKFNNNKSELTLKKNSIEPEVIHLPNHFYPLNQYDNEMSRKARAYLKTRGISPEQQLFYLSSGGNIDANKWVGRLIIPIYKNIHLIFYQGRDLIGDRKRYISPKVDRDKVLYGFDELLINTTLPLYVVEGFFDACVIPGSVAVLGSKMTDAQIRWLNKSTRPKVVIPDRKGDGHILAEQAIQLNWSVATPSIGSCKDINEAVQRYGKLYILKQIEHTRRGISASAAVKIYCDLPTKKRRK